MTTRPATKTCECGATFPNRTDDVNSCEPCLDLPAANPYWDDYGADEGDEARMVAAADEVEGRRAHPYPLGKAA